MEATKRQEGGALPYVVLLGMLVAVALLLRVFAPAAGRFLAEPKNAFYSILAILFFFGYVVNRLAPRTHVPSFVWSIFFGIALQPILAVLTRDTGALTVLIELIAALILFGGGAEVSFRHFRRWFGVIASLAFLGTVLTAVLFALALGWLFGWLGVAVPAAAIALVSAILASTDPAAIIPSLSRLRFRRPHLKLIAVSESAVNDVVGTILTRFVLIAVTGVLVIQAPAWYFASLTGQDTITALVQEFAIGIACGFLGFVILHFWTKRSKGAGVSEGTDTALYFGVPIGIFSLSGVLGGSGFLSTFLAGLLYEAETHTRKVVTFFEHFLEAFGKPTIFLLLGGIVPVATLGKTALIGILAALVFIFLVRPLIVFISLAPWVFRHHGRLTLPDALFLSFIRETGVIPAALLVMIGTALPYAEYLFGIGIWVILLTLLIEPPLTPYVARKLGVAQ